MNEPIKKEAIYNSEIKPLMDQIYEICRTHEIAMMGNFHLGGDLLCGTANLGEETDPPMILLLIGAALHNDLLAELGCSKAEELQA